MKFFSNTSRRPLRLGAIVALLILPVTIPAAATRIPDVETKRPNFLIIMTDDQGHDTLTNQFMPFTKSMIADQGINLTRGYMSTALCCPSRASFLTGKYARHDGVRTNEDELTQTTVADRLQKSGYYTGLIGKYLNSWPGDPRPEYNYWACWVSGYNDPRMNVGGMFQNVPGYLTYILRDYALDFFNQMPEDKPFFLMLTPHAPHGPATPAPGDENLYSDLPKWRPPSFNPAEQADKPLWLQNTPQLTSQQITREVDNFRLNQLRCLHSVDIAVKDVLQRLQEMGKLDNTFVVFYSDNGYFWGEHRLIHKNRVYEEASHGPFALRYPPLVPTPRTDNRLIQVIDLAPTMYELAGVPIPDDVDGKSLVPLMRNSSEWRDAVLLEGWPGANESEHYQALRTDRFVYVETDNDTSELYDTRADPFQLNNLINDPAFAKTVKKLSKRLRKEDF